MTFRRRAVLLLLPLAAILGVGYPGYLWWQRNQPPPVIRNVPRQGGLDVTLWALSDLHFGSPVLGRDSRGKPTWIDATPVREEMDRQMRAVTGKPWPQNLGGTVGEPSALLIAGDLTEDGKPEEWRRFSAFYGLDSPAGRADDLPPVCECPGNHDYHTGHHVAERIEARHGGTRYSLDFGDLHVVNLGAGPDDTGLSWLQRDLAATGRERPVILYNHYPLLGPWSRSWWGDRPALAERLAEIVAPFNVVAILHGHYHLTGRYQWRGIDVYNIGSIKHGARTFGVVRVTDDTFTYACWNAEKNGWWWWHSKRINAGPGSPRDEVSGISPAKGLLSAPAIPYPVDMR